MRGEDIANHSSDTALNEIKNWNRETSMATTGGTHHVRWGYVIAADATALTWSNCASCWPHSSVDLYNNLLLWMLVRMDRPYQPTKVSMMMRAVGNMLQLIDYRRPTNQASTASERRYQRQMSRHRPIEIDFDQEFSNDQAFTSSHGLYNA